MSLPLDDALLDAAPRLGDQIVNELRRYLAGEPFENEITELLARQIG